ncbi:branched-chain amino acid ABC transporter substrate-binding protein [Streptomyces sp. NPDC058067]|uniref:branched-chain amino acid ABC transporter substrate-binding protein n=1 Tax=Streptomyces sp. NPDC058067 TaxID=3346324 RepID=UPI0036E29F25
MSPLTWPRWREWSWRTVKLVAAGVALAVLASVAAVVITGKVSEARARCADGVSHEGADRECVGVTDGSYAFAGHLKRVEKKIEDENERVYAHRTEDPYVTVAYLTSFTVTDDDSNSEDSVRHELEGAYLAQIRHNRGDLAASPKIRLLVANTGSGARHWEHTVDELIARKAAPNRLVAVAGLGPSTDRDVAALRKLSQNGIATVSSIMTATDITGIQGFVRVAPTNADEARAGAAYLKRQKKKYRTAVVIQDAAKSNLYARTLGEAFTEEYPDKDHRLVADRITYDSSVPSAWPNELHYTAEQLCGERPEVVYFAGRGRHLSHFLNALANRTCQAQQFTVFTGDDTTNLTPKELAAAARTGVTVLYTGLAHADMWRDDPGAVSGPSAGSFQPGGTLDKWFPDDARYDGQDIMGHDAVLTAAQGIRMASNWQGKVTGRSVGRMFLQLDGDRKVPGASGFLSFKDNGDPRDKAVPVLRLTPKGESELVDVSAPGGRPATRG